MGLIRIHARKSDLARLQAYRVGLALQKKHPHLEVEYSFRESLGDQNLQDPLWKMPEKGVFTEDFVQDLKEGRADLVVHSWKDLPTEVRPGAEIFATLPRADQRDLLLMKKSSWGKSQLRVFSSSPRRAHHLTDLIPSLLPWPCQFLSFESVRGNIPTRLRKWREGDVDGLVVAKAALDRLIQTHDLPMQEEFAETRAEIEKALSVGEWMALPLSENPNAAAQGALAIEIRSDRQDLKEILRAIHDPPSYQSVLQERTRLAALGGGCHQKIGIAVLPRGNSQVWFERGLTDRGETLLRREWQSDRPAPQKTAAELWSLPESAESQLQRSSAASLGAPPAGGIWVSRVSAWPEAWTAHLRQSTKTAHVIWAAGLKTWQKLAQKGVWVHGCAEGLGEQEPTQTQALRPVPQWTKLTHTLAKETPNGMTSLVTYELNLAKVDFKIPDHAQFFYWRSGSQFREALRRYPRLQTCLHASGPGSTQQVLLEELKAEQVYCFLNETDWRAQCQIPPTNPPPRA